MESLNGRTLRRAIEFAAEHERTSIGIIMDIHSAVTVLHRDILDEYRNLRGGINYEIGFSNGSYIRIHSLNGGQGVRGFRYNIVLVSSAINNEDACVVFGRMENPEHGHPGFFYRYDHRTESYYEDPFVVDDLIDTFNSYQPGYTVKENWSGLNICEYECSFINGRFEMKKREAPDFGELSPSQELNDFVNTLVQGE